MNLDAAVKIAATVTGTGAVDGLRQSLDGVSKSVEGVTGKFSGLAGSVKMLAGSLGILAFGAMVKEVINLGDELYKMSQRTGVSVEALSTLRAAGKLADVSLEDLAKSLVKFDAAISKAGSGDKGAAGAFASIGISVAQLKAAKPEELVLKVADAFAKVPDGADKTRVAIELFGRSGAVMIPLLNSGSEAIEAFGVKMSTDFASRAEAFNDQLTIMGQKTKMFAVQAAQSMLPMLQELGTEILRMIDTKPDFIGFFDQVGEVVRVLSMGIVTLYQTLSTLVDGVITAARIGADVLTGDFDVIGKRIDALSDRTKTRIEETARFAANMTKNSLWFGEGTVEEIKGRRDAATRIQGRSIAPGAKIDAAQMDRSGDADAKKLENAIKQYENETKKIQAETAALGQSALVKKELLALQDLEAKGIKEGTAAYSRLKEERMAALQTQYEAQRSFSTGVDQFLTDYVENATNSAKQVQQVLTSAFKGAEDALVSFVMTGKFQFNKFATAIISDMVRIAIQRAIIAPIMGGLFKGGGGIPDNWLLNANGNVFGGGAVQAFATGGVVSRPTIFPMANGGVGLMGEAGPEAIMPLKRDSQGRLGVSGSGSTTNVSVVVNTDGSVNSKSDSNAGQNLGRAIAAAVKNEIMNQKRPGGLLAAGAIA